MSQRQLQLVFGNSITKTRRSKLDSVKFRPLRVGSSKSPLVIKVEQLEREHPAAAALLERLVDDALDPRAQWLPPLE